MRRASVTLLAAAVLAGCSTGAAPTTPTTAPATAAPTTPTTVSAAPSPAPTPTQPPRTVEFSKVFAVNQEACTRPGAVYNDTSPPYSGPPPHPIDAAEVRSTRRNVQHNPFTGFYGELQPPKVVLDVDRNQVQLLACIRIRLGSRTGSVTCTFDRGVARSRTWPLYEATYEVTVLEARSGRKIAVVTAPGTEDPEESCPGFAVDDPGTVVARSLTEQALTDAVRPVVTATV